MEGQSSQEQNSDQAIEGRNPVAELKKEFLSDDAHRILDPYVIALQARATELAAGNITEGDVNISKKNAHGNFEQVDAGWYNTVEKDNQKIRYFPTVSFLADKTTHEPASVIDYRISFAEGVYVSPADSPRLLLLCSKDRITISLNWKGRHPPIIDSIAGPEDPLLRRINLSENSLPAGREPSDGRIIIESTGNSDPQNPNLTVMTVVQGERTNPPITDKASLRREYDKKYKEWKNSGVKSRQAELEDQLTIIMDKLRASERKTGETRQSEVRFEYKPEENENGLVSHDNQFIPEEEFLGILSSMGKFIPSSDTGNLYADGTPIIVLQIPDNQTQS